MTSGDMTVKDAAKLQTFSNVKDCKPAVVKQYKGKFPPRCGCAACWDKWIEVNQ